MVGQIQVTLHHILANRKFHYKCRFGLRTRHFFNCDLLDIESAQLWYSIQLVGECWRVQYRSKNTLSH